jgi:type IV pilus assembly protein PilQ
MLIHAGWLQATSLEGVKFSSLPGNQVAVELTFSDPVPNLSDFATEQPARIAIDFPGVTSALDQKDIPIQIGVARSLTALETSNRTRVVINLNESVPYTIKHEGNQVYIALNPMLTPPPLPEQPGVVTEQPTAVPPSAPRLPEMVPEEATPPPPMSPFHVAASGLPRGTLKNIDFRRSRDGSGRVILTLPTEKTPVQVTQKGDEIIVNVAGTELPQRLLRRLDVIDFATPVVSIESRPKGSDIEVRIETTDDYEYMAFQSDNLFTIELRSLTPAERDQLEREKIVYEGDRLSLNFQDIEVRAVLQLLADFTGLNLVASDTVRGGITLRLKNVPWDQALDIILKTKGLSMRQNGNVILVAPTQEIAAQEKLEMEATKQVAELAPLRSEFIQVNYAKAADLAALLKSPDNNLLSDRGQVTTDSRTNTLLIQDTSIRLEDIRRLVLRLDVPVRQVMIESRVVIAENNFARDLGVRFGLTGSMGRTGSNELLVGGGMLGNMAGSQNIDKGPFMGVYDTVAYQQPGVTPNAPNAQYPLTPYNSSIELGGAEALMVNLPTQLGTTGAVNFLLGKVGSHLLQLELSAMQTEGRGEVVSAPRVITSDRHKAVIKLGQQIPYQEATASGATNTSFKDAVLKLEVTPQITPDDRIIMDLMVNKDAPDFGNLVNGVPPIDTRTVETSILVDNGETVVLGGVYEGNQFFSKEQVPWLGDLPVVGNLFKQRANQENETELLIFVTPKILKDDLIRR